MADYQDVSVRTAQDLASAFDMPGDAGAASISPLFIDGVNVDNLFRALGQQDFRSGGQQANSNARFWATPAREQSDTPIRDIIQIDLSTARLTNKVAFDLARFPHRAEVEYSINSTGSNWQPLLDAGGRPIVIETVDSNPPILSQNANQNLVHPHHFGAGHWQNQDIKTAPVVALRFRVVLTRPRGGVPPTNSQGDPLPYSLGVRSFVVGYEIEERFDIPERPLALGSTTLHQPIEATRDILGSTITFSERETPAQNLLGDGIWRSGPQPLPYAVVNLYADVQEDGEPQVIERFFIDPITSGCSVNVYYTEDIPDFDLDDPWVYIVWTPVARDFAVRRGFMRFDPTRARFFKFEFSDLAPEPYDATSAIVRKVKMFPGGLENRDPIDRSGNDGGSGTFVNAAIADLVAYQDNDLPVTQNLTDLSRGFSPTEVFYSTDPAAAARLRDLSEHYNFLPWQGGTQMPHWPSTQQHPCVEAEVLHDQRVAFYVALANLAAYRLDYGFEEDTEQYLEYFFDGQNFTNEGWLQEIGDVSTPQEIGGPWVITSKVLTSRSQVRGVQFATTQSPPMQLLPDDDFNSGVVAEEPPSYDTNGDRIYPYWLPFSSNGEALPEFTLSDEFATDVGTTVRIKREGANEQPALLDTHLWRNISRNYRTWLGITDRGLTYDDLAREQTEAETNAYGGIYNRQRITPAAGARIYAAARVFSKIDLGTPVYVQIFDELADGGVGAVVSETPATIEANKIVEWYTSYDTGSDVALASRSWDEVSMSVPTYSALNGETFAAIGTKAGAAQPTRLVARLVQKGKANASFYADTVSLFEESILWEFSNDGGQRWFPAPGVRNNPHGVLLFPAPNDTALLTTYDAIEGRHPSAAVPSYASLSSTRYADLEHDPRTQMPERNRLMWRATCGRPGQHVSALAVRPWYVNTTQGVLSREGVDIAGPNQALYDHFQPVAFDPRWRLWSKPVPQSWYFAFRQFILTPGAGYVPTPEGVVTLLGDSFVVPRVAIAPSTDVLGDALVIPVGGPTPPEEQPLNATLNEVIILRET